MRYGGSKVWRTKAFSDFFSFISVPLPLFGSIILECGAKSTYRYNTELPIRSDCLISIDVKGSFIPDQYVAKATCAKLSFMINIKKDHRQQLNVGPSQGNSRFKNRSRRLRCGARVLYTIRKSNIIVVPSDWAVVVPCGYALLLCWCTSVDVTFFSEARTYSFEPWRSFECDYESLA